ncbi:MAG: alpha/beta hydrolase family protein [Gemmatimonadaceae bacterium]
MTAVRLLVVAAATLVLAACSRALRLADDDSAVVLAHQTLRAPDPGLPGAFAVRTLAYGSGTDDRRPVYRDSVAVRTTTVDASAFVSLEKKPARTREKYWGFGPKKFPLNARVWYPDAPGRFPLVLVVHGNHDMKDFSDPGYEYLGRLLASRGYVVASVDMNFLNGSIRGENDARGWMLLQHVKAWHGFDSTAGNPLAGRADLDRIALMGHSRGGEAVAQAASFNAMERYPDDAKVKLGFDYGVRAIVAIAPVDGQYKPAGRLVPVKGVSYLVLHGSHDGDVSTFQGLRQYDRIDLGDDDPSRFKAAVYVYRANHGQWNTVWGNRDRGRRSGRSLQLRALMDPADQRRVAEVYLSAFLDATLKGKTEYMPLFRDHRVAGGWLPKTMYVTRFEQSGYRPLATFDEDVDVNTGSASGVRIDGDSLSTWREARIPFRGRNEDTQETNGVWLGWNNRIAGADTTRRGPPAAYTITLSDSLVTAWRISAGDWLSLDLTAMPEVPGPRRAPRAPGSDSAAPEAKAPERKGKAPEPPPVDLTVELEDAAGTVARLPLSRFGAVRRPLETHILRRGDREKQAFRNLYELVLQSYTMPLADFVAAQPGFDPARLRKVRLLFDRVDAGTVLVDEIGVTSGGR